MKDNNNSLKGAFLSLSLAVTVGGWFILANGESGQDNATFETTDAGPEASGDLGGVMERSPISKEGPPSSLLIPVDRGASSRPGGQSASADRTTAPEKPDAAGLPLIPTVGPVRTGLGGRTRLFQLPSVATSALPQIEVVQPLDLKPIPRIRAPQERRPAIRTRSSR